jgi:hypothetical protein
MAFASSLSITSLVDIIHNILMGKYAVVDFIAMMFSTTFVWVAGTLPLKTYRPALNVAQSKDVIFSSRAFTSLLTSSITDAFLRFVMSRGRCKFMVVERIYFPQSYPPSCLPKDLERNRCLEFVSIFSTQKSIYKMPPLSSTVRRLRSILRTF